MTSAGSDRSFDGAVPRAYERYLVPLLFEPYAADLAAGGFASAPRIETIALRSRARSARDAALAFCHGTPLRHEIETRAPGRLDEATATAEEEIARRFGRDAIDAKMQALVVTVAR